MEDSCHLSCRTSHHILSYDPFNSSSMILKISMAIICAMYYFTLWIIVIIIESIKFSRENINALSVVHFQHGVLR